MICRLSATSPNSISDLHELDTPALMTLAEEIAAREERESWDNVAEAIARVYDLLSVMRVEALALGGVKRHNLPEVARMPRPGEQVEQIPVVTPGQAARMMMAS
jgi:hypothetical protein